MNESLHAVSPTFKILSAICGLSKRSRVYAVDNGQAVYEKLPDKKKKNVIYLYVFASFQF